MAQVTWDVNKDSRVALYNGTTSLGAGATPQNQIGLYSGYLYRTLLGFNYSFTGMTAISAATLYVKTSSQVNVAFGASPDIYLRRLTASWSEGTANSPMSGSNAVEWSNQPAQTSTNQASGSLGTVENTWKSFNITALVQDAYTAGTFYGLVLMAQNEAGGGDVGEIWAREYSTSSDPYIVVTYTTNSVPGSPTSMSAGGSLVGTTPSLSFTHSDPDGDALLNYDLQVSTDSTFASVTHWNVSAQTTGISGNVVTRTYAGTALSRGTTYYWRARTRSSSGESGDGAWSSTQSFAVRQLPTVSLAEPSATGRLGRLSFTPGSGWASPRLYVGWTFSCADGGTQETYEVEVYNDNAGAVGTSLYDSGPVTSTAASLVVPATLTEANYYHVRVQVTCSHGETSSWTSYVRFRTRWGTAVHRFDMTSAPSTLALSGLLTTTGASSAVELEYATGATTTTPTTWYSSVSAAGLARYFFYRVWLLAWGSSPATSPSLDELRISYSSAVLAADVWAQAASAFTVDTGTFVYGTQSVVGTGDGVAARTFYQQVDVTPNTDYVLSARLKTQGNAGAFIALAGASSGSVFAQSTAVTATSDWSRVETPVWNSGANTSVYVQLAIGSTAGNKAWFDAVKLEASRVVTPWTPSFLAEAVVLDAGGLQIDASNGGIFRLRTSGSDVVTLNAGGLTIGRDAAADSVSLASTANPLQIGPASGANLVVDAAAVQARNNGAAATLLLQDSGGKVTINGASSPTTNASGLQLGADVNVYRSAADTLKTDDKLIVASTSSAKDQITIPDTTAGAGLTIGGDTNLYRAAASQLKTDDDLVVTGYASILGHTPVKGSTGTATTVPYNAATTWYKVGNHEAVFTPAYSGQRWLIVGTYVFQDNSALTSVVDDFALRLDSNNTGTLLAWLQVNRHQLPGVASAYISGATMAVYTATSTATVYAYLYTESTATGHTATIYVNSDYGTKVQVFPLG